jgi:phosphoglycerate dehydrogenase-like enzyme
MHIAEFILARLLYHTKEFRAFEELQREHRWPDRVAMSRPGLRGKQALIIGYGGVGRETARLLTTLGIRIVAVAHQPGRTPYQGYTPHPDFGDPDGHLPEQIVTPDALHDVLPDADVIVLAVPLTPETHYLIDAAALARTKASAILINIARGGVVDTQALLAALDAGRLAHAYLDVFEQEPLPPDSPVWDHPRISITPHMAGVMPDAETALRDLFRQNLPRYINRLPLINQLDRRRFI